MRAIKKRLKRLNELIVADEVDAVFLTQIDIEKFEVRYRIGGKNPKDFIEVYPTKEEAEKAISQLENTKGLIVFWDNIGFCDD